MLPWLSQTPLTLCSKAKNIKVEFNKNRSTGRKLHSEISFGFYLFQP